MIFFDLKESDNYNQVDTKKTIDVQCGFFIFFFSSIKLIILGRLEFDLVG
jgi:hypothetical protein